MKRDAVTCVGNDSFIRSCIDLLRFVCGEVMIAVQRTSHLNSTGPIRCIWSVYDQGCFKETSCSEPYVVTPVECMNLSANRIVSLHLIFQLKASRMVFS